MCVGDGEDFVVREEIANGVERRGGLGGDMGDIDGVAVAIHQGGDAAMGGTVGVPDDIEMFGGTVLVHKAATVGLVAIGRAGDGCACAIEEIQAKP